MSRFSSSPTGPRTQRHEPGSDRFDGQRGDRRDRLAGRYDDRPDRDDGSGPDGRWVPIHTAASILSYCTITAHHLVELGALKHDGTGQRVSRESLDRFLAVERESLAELDRAASERADAAAFTHHGVLIR